MARRVSMIYGSSPVVNVYGFDKSVMNDNRYNIRIFQSPSIEWALFVTNNRNNDAFGDNNLDLKYDIVVGPVANDDLAMLFRQFSNGYIDREALMKGMEFKKFTDQYSFHTSKAIKTLIKEREYNV